MPVFKIWTKTPPSLAVITLIFCPSYFKKDLKSERAVGSLPGFCTIVELSMVKAQEGPGSCPNTCSDCNKLVTH